MATKRWLITAKDYSIILDTDAAVMPPHSRLIGYIKASDGAPPIVDIYCVGAIAKREALVLNVLVNKCEELYIPTRMVNLVWRNNRRAAPPVKKQLKLWE
jgi:hypothetical protein